MTGVKNEVSAGRTPQKPRSKPETKTKRRCDSFECASALLSRIEDGVICGRGGYRYTSRDRLGLEGQCSQHLLSLASS